MPTIAQKIAVKSIVLNRAEGPIKVAGITTKASYQA